MAEWPTTLFPCRVLPYTAPSTEAAFPLRVFNPETQMTQTAALVVDADENEVSERDLEREALTDEAMTPRVSEAGLTQTSSCFVQGTKIKQEPPPPTALPQFVPFQYPPSEDMALPTPYTKDSPLLVSSRQTVEGFEELRSGHTVGVYFAENGEVRILDDAIPEATEPSPTDSNDPMNAALWNAYLTGLYNGLSLATGGEMRQGRPLFWSPNLSANVLPVFPTTPPVPKRSFAETRTRRPNKKPRHNKYSDRSCRNCGTKTTPFWRKDRYSGEPLCNACGLYYSKNDDHRPASLWREPSRA